jgi:methyl-accepting chemotaxis protein
VAQSTRSIASKLYLCFGALLVAATLMGGAGLYNLISVTSARIVVMGQDSSRLELASAIEVNVHEIVSLDRGILMRSYAKDHAGIESYRGKQTAEIDSLKRNLQEFAPIVSTPAGQEFIRNFAEVPARYAELDEKLYRLAIADDPQHALDFQNAEVFPYSKGLLAQADTYVKAIAQSVEASKVEAHSQVNSAIWLNSILMIVCLAIGGAVIVVVRKVNADLLNTALELGSGAEQIASAASQVASASQTLAQGATEQAASIEETSASSEQINAMARRNTDNSQTTAGIVASTALRFVETSASMADMVLAMSGISESSEKISRIIKVIDQIAFQTNILALNAAVEAARAGESGAGFAVVAEEVRNLAQRSAQAAQDTASLIEESITRSKAGSVKVDQVAAVIHAITAESAKMKTLVDQINDGSQEQSRGIDQVTRSIRQMEVVTQGNAASAEQSAAAAEQLTAQSESVKEIVNTLNALVGVSSTHRATPNLGKASRSGMGTAGKTKSLTSFHSAAKPRPAPARASHSAVATLDPHDAEASFHEF